MRALTARSLRLPLFFFLLNLTLVVGAPTVFAQTTNKGAADLGPRNPGNAAAVPVCPVGSPAKFSPNCVDLTQPPSQPPQPPAGGAGNIIGFVGPQVGLWFEAIPVFEAVASVKGPSVVPTEPITGLGPAFNSNSCVSCHQAPVVGGSSGGVVSINGTSFNMPLSFSSNGGNPELLAMSDRGNTFNTNPAFPLQFNPNGISFLNVPINGPSLEVRAINGGGSGGFVIQPGAVAELFTTQSRTDSGNCMLAQFPFLSLPNRSISFRIPTPTFGLGLVEATPDLALVANLAINSSDPNVRAAAAALGITGTFNRNGNDGTITRFGWKAQNKSLLVFAGEASNVEMGVTNDLFPNEKTLANSVAGSCLPSLQPEDELIPATFPAGTGAANIASIISSNAENNAAFMRLNAPPSQCDAVQTRITNPYGTPGPAVCPPFTSTSVLNGQTLFNNNASTGCALCHSPNQVSGPSQNTSLSNQTYHPFSDFAIHNMGVATNGLADGITQGLATSQFFRTAPLWGLGQRIFFLHDGRASDLATAITAHCPATSSAAGNESCGSVNLFNGLTKVDQQAVLDFLRSL